MFSFRNRGNYESSVYTIDFIIIRVIVKKKKKISPRIRGSRVDRTVRVKGAD